MDVGALLAVTSCAPFREGVQAGIAEPKTLGIVARRRAFPAAAIMCDRRSVEVQTKPARDPIGWDLGEP
jgi:hypothetical protein